MASEETKRQWSIWEKDEDIQKQAIRFRDAAVEALCCLEKHQSKCISSIELNLSKYLSTLFQTMRGELQSFGIDSHSKVLFIGSGAFPVSALIIAKEFGAKVLGVDIDSESVLLASHTAKVFDLET